MQAFDNKTTSYWKYPFLNKFRSNKHQIVSYYIKIGIQII